MSLHVLAAYGLLTYIPHSENVSVICPFHQEAHASLSMNVENGRWICFGCQQRGDILSFVQLHEATYGPSQYNQYNKSDVTEFEAMVIIAKMKHDLQELDMHLTESAYIAPHKTAAESRKAAAEFFMSLPKVQWSAEPAHYLRAVRGFSADALTFFDVRKNPTSSHPIIVPLFEQGVFKGTLSRRLNGDEPKYLYNEGFKKSLTLGGTLCQGPVMLVEGYFDKMKTRQLGFENVACLYGWHCSLTQAEKIRKYATKIICATDNDDKGDAGYERIRDLFAGDVPLYRFAFPHAKKDPCELTQSELMRGLFICQRS